MLPNTTLNDLLVFSPYPKLDSSPSHNRQTIVGVLMVHSVLVGHLRRFLVSVSKPCYQTRIMFHVTYLTYWPWIASSSKIMSYFKSAMPSPSSCVYHLSLLAPCWTLTTFCLWNLVSYERVMGKTSWAINLEIHHFGVF